mmetsp:Transcript_13090/g.29561  ORF Transcript_13090/g.29561 Transcript_13090/m.29561 type:complete len:219 (+) Transcript_13090:310-966(+)
MCGWQGITVEPVSHVFKQLCQNYARWPKVRPLRAAISSTQQHEGLVSSDHGETNRLIAKGTNLTTMRGGFEHVPALNLEQLWRLAGAEGTVESMTTTNVAASSLKNLAHTHNDEAASSTQSSNGEGIKLTRLDILVIDAEGAEAEILGDDDLPRPRPALILFEHAHLTQGAQTAISRRLKAQGYEWLADFRNLDRRGKRLPPVNRLFGKVSARNSSSI